MPLLLISGRMVGKFLLIPFTVIVLSSLLFFLFKGADWAFSAVCGGLAALLPNAVFMIFFWRHQAYTPIKGRVAWIFVAGEALKVVANFIILLVALVSFKAVVLPLVVTWVLVLVLQIFAPAVVNNKG